MKLDRESLLVEASATDTLRALETYASGHDLTLGAEPADDTMIGVWLTNGAPGARDPFGDPADHVIAGITMMLPNGKTLDIRPGPRRAVGPDLVALVTFPGTRVLRVWLRLHLKTARRPELPLPVFDREPPLTEGETNLVLAITRAL